MFKINMETFERWCRLCAKEVETTIMIFGAESVSMQLQKKLNTYLLIEIDEDDKLPKNICTQCCARLHNVCEFIDAARNAQETLLKQSLMSECHTHRDNYGRTIPNIIRKAKRNTNTVSKSKVNTENNGDVTYLYTGDGENVTLTRLKTIQIQQSKNIDNKNESTSKPYHCKTCFRDFHSDIALQNHIWSHTKDKVLGKPYSCTVCEMEFDYKNDLVSHLKKHKNPRKCKLCQRTFRSEKNLTDHMVIHFSKKKTFTCDECGRTYATKSSLKNHCVTHSNEKPFLCIVCKKKFKRYQELRFHVNKHTGAKPFKCSDCEKCFSTSGNCYAHKIRMHTNTKHKTPRQMQNPSLDDTISAQPNPNVNKTLPVHLYKYQCQLCSHTFKKKENFMYHMYKHTGVKPFHCIYCSDKFVTRRGHYLHCESCHPTKERPLTWVSRNKELKQRKKIQKAEEETI